jgi:aminoglycoside phosphotransferase (APT) family kinase protein
LAESFDAETLARLVLAHVDADPASLRFVPIRTGKHNTSYWVDSNLDRLVLRIAPPDDAGFLFYERHMMRQEPRLHALIRTHTTIPAAEVVGYDFSRALIDRDYLVMTALPGTPLSDVAGLTASQFERALEQVGDALRQLHALTAPEQLGVEAYGYLGGHHPMEPQPAWAKAFHVMWHKLLDDVAACGCYSADEAGLMRNLLELHLELFDRPVKACLLHMDVWSQNILIDRAGNVTGLVDFDRALWGDVEIEFAVLDYCGISEPAFWQGYAAERDESPAALVRRRIAEVYAHPRLAARRPARRRALQAAKPEPGHAACAWLGRRPVGARQIGEKLRCEITLAPICLAPTTCRTVRRCYNTGY